MLPAGPNDENAIGVKKAELRLRLQGLGLNGRTIFLLLATFFLAWGFIQFDAKDVRFAKIGLSIPGLNRQAVQPSLGQEPKLYITEIYLGVLGILSVCGQGFTARLCALRRARFTQFLAFLLVAGLIRACLNLGQDSILVIRNAAFVWYLAIPLLLALSGLSSRALELFATALFSVGIALFCLLPLWDLVHLRIALHWIPFLGLYPLLYLAFFSPRRSLRWIAYYAFGLAFGFGCFLSFQRTNLLGCLLLLPLFYVKSPKRKIFFQRLASLLLATGVAIAFVFLLTSSLFKYELDPQARRNYLGPFQKAAENEAGLEIFRTELWRDAWGEFVQHPFVGIGFHDQVVYRIFYRRLEDQTMGFAPNDGTSWNFGNKIPVSGPHNSYLNALARLGFLGIGFLFLHLWALRILWRERLFALFFLTYAEVVYAFFNVGLEGPVRSFNLLVGLGAAAIVVSQERNKSIHRA